MKNRFPRRNELLVLIAISLLCTVIAAMTGKYDVGLAVMGAPVFLVAALMGFRRDTRSSASPPVEAATASTPGDGPSPTP
jgi:hypothetical protein